MGEPTYKENFVNSRVTNDTRTINYVLSQIKECHPEELGWVLGTPTIEPNPDGKTVTITVPLAKYDIAKTSGRHR